MINRNNKYVLATISATSVIYALGASNIHGDSKMGEVTAYALNVRSGPSASNSAVGGLRQGDKVTILSSKNGWYNIKYGSKSGWVNGSYISTISNPSNDSTNSDSSNNSSSNGKIFVTTAGLNVRSGPSTSNSIIGGLRKGDKVEILSSKSGWYNIKYGSKTGWVSGSYISTISNPSNDSTSSEPSNNSSLNGKMFVATAGLNVRAGDSTKYKIIGYVSKNHSVEIVGVANSGWYKVKLSDGTIGYSSNEYLKEGVQTPTNPPIDNANNDVTVIDSLIATANLNVRSGPSTSNSTVGIVYKENNVSIIERTNSNWYKIKLPNGKLGYCSAAYLKSKSELDSVTNKPENSDDVSYSMQVKSYAYYTGTITATGTKPIFGRTIAVDPTIIPYGSRVYIPEFDKTFIAEDCGGGIKGNKIDIYMDTEQECLNWGVRNITIYILK